MYSAADLAVVAANPPAVEEDDEAADIDEEDPDVLADKERREAELASIPKQFVCACCSVFCSFQPLQVAEPVAAPSSDIVARLVCRVQDFNADSDSELKAYKSHCHAVVEDFVASYHPQFRFELAAIEKPHMVVQSAMVRCLT